MVRVQKGDAVVTLAHRSLRLRLYPNQTILFCTIVNTKVPSYLWYKYYKMAIRVEKDVQSTRPAFPKIMCFSDNLVLVARDEDNGCYVAIHLTGTFAGAVAKDFRIAGCEDYNGPITIQNA